VADRPERKDGAHRAYLDCPQVRQDLRPWLQWVLDRHARLDAVTEIRILGKDKLRGTWSGLFGPDDIDDLIGHLAPLATTPRVRLPRGDHPRVGEANIYFSLQGVSPDLANGTPRRITRARTTVKDRDIVSYTLFVVDVDPERQPRGVSATDAEKAHAREVCSNVEEWLARRGVQALRADSGNGYHLLVPLTPSTVDQVSQSAQDAHDLLRLLHQRFSTPQAKVDTSTYNPSRIFKLYGTRAVKGENTPERPHRWASIDLDQIPEDTDLFKLLREEIDEFRAAEQAPSSSTRPTAASSSKTAKGNDPETQARWRAWRDQALAALPLDAVYGELLTGKSADSGWLQCRDPASPTGDRHPSAGVADGSGEAERGTFHSFRNGVSSSVFDFLIQQGRATDFRDACRVIAELTGIPLTAGGESPADHADLVARFEARWNDLEDEDARLALLHEAITTLLAIQAVKREPLLRQIRTVTGIPARVFQETVSEVRRSVRQARKSPPPTPSPTRGRSVVDYVINRQTVAGLFDAIIEAVEGATRFFRNERDMVFVRRGIGPVIITDANVGGFLAALLEIRFLKDTEDGLSFLRYGVLPGELARAFVADPRVWAKLPPLTLYCRSPLFDGDWTFVGRPGYQPGSAIFYDGPKVAPSTDGAPLLHQAIQDFRFKSEADLVNFVGVLLTAVTMPHWGRGHPFLAINGNKPGVGKTTLARVLGVIVEGAEPSTVSYVPDDAEFEKQIATRVEAGDRIIVVDNAKTRRSVESAVLERCITDSRLNFRRLGSNTSITRPQNDILFVLTMNLTTLGVDLRRRALPVNLMIDEDVREADYAMPDVVGFVLAHRLEIVAELAGMVRIWLDSGRPACERPAQHSTSQPWATTIDAILRLSGFDGFLTNFEESAHAFDPRYELMLDIAQEHHDRPPSPAGTWTGWLETLLEDRFKDRRGNPKSARSRSTIVGNLFGEYLGSRFTVGSHAYRLVKSYPDGEGRKPAYHFEQVGS